MSDQGFDPEALIKVLPWAKPLPEGEYYELFEDLRGVAARSIESGGTVMDFAQRLLQELAGWKATSEVWADPEAIKAITEAKIEDFGEVQPPSIQGYRPIGMFLDEASEMTARSEPADTRPPLPVRSPRKLCTSHIKDMQEAVPGRSRWCILATGHSGDHRDRVGATWTTQEQDSGWTVDEVAAPYFEALRTFLGSSTIPHQRSTDE